MWHIQLYRDQSPYVNQKKTSQAERFVASTHALADVEMCEQSRRNVA
jgi:hypothetical protein